MTHGELESRLGHKFTQPGLLAQALTHRSFGQPHNERLEFLGDSVLNCAVAKMLFDGNPGLPEGELSRLRANLVNQSALAELAGQLGLGALIRLGEGEQKTGGAARPSILADALEALLGAIFLDAGFTAAENAVRALLSARVAAAHAGRAVKDAKTALQEALQAQRLPLPQYTVLRIGGEPHRQTFYVQCDVGTHGVSVQGQGASRRAAEQDAAAQALAQIELSMTGDSA